MAYELGIIGGGNMGTAIARGAIAARVLRPEQVVIAEPDAARRDVAAMVGCDVFDAAGAVVEADQILLAVKPQVFGDVAGELGELSRPTIVITIMAGLSTEHIRSRLGLNARLIRAMPNTPCQLGEGMTGLALGDGSEPGDEQLAWHIFEALGRTTMLPEDLMHAVTAVSGSGPAYVYLLAELMEQAAMRIGLDEATAQLLVVQTIIGAGRMLRETGATPADLRRVVTTPGGTTAAAHAIMHERDLPGILIEALTAARDRGIELDRLNGD
jgi:pyrroline-5-carboxylate reductase